MPYIEENKKSPIPKTLLAVFLLAAIILYTQVTSSCVRVEGHKETKEDKSNINITQGKNGLESHNLDNHTEDDVMAEEVVRIDCSNLKTHPECHDCTSQGNQDEILTNIFDTIGVTNRHCVEFGFGYSNPDSLKLEDFNKQDSRVGTGLNTHALVAKGWTPTFFDAEYENPSINLYKNALTLDTIGEAFQNAGVLQEADYISIDVDSVDVWLLYGLLKSGYRPRVISSEYNANFPLHMALSCEKKWAPWKHRSRIYGSSASALNLVAEMYGYKAVAITPYLDIFFVREDILEEKCIDDSLVSFEVLVGDFVGTQFHDFCLMEDAQRIVDFPLAVQGFEEKAKAKAVEQMKELNKIFQEKYKKSFCQLD